MIRNKNFLCIALTTWEKEFMNTMVQIMSLLSQNNKVLFVDYEYTVKDMIVTLAGKQKAPVQRMIGIENRLRTVRTAYGSEVHVLTPPPVLPINWIKNDNPYKMMLKLNGNLVRGCIQRALRELKMEDPIVINGYNPFFGLPLAGDFNEILNLYYCYDEIKGDQWYNFHGPEIEREYIEKTDAVITTSEGLYRSKSPLHPNCFVVKNGVDFELFNAAATLEVKSPHKPRVVGYTGSIDQRFDIQTMTYVIERLPEIEFRFIGRQANESAVMALGAFSNVKLFGSMKPYQIPEAVSQIDAGVIPYIKNELTKGVYPLKINEYLAAGKPVVMSDFAHLPEFNEVVRMAANKEQFLNSLKEELYSDNKEKINKRIEFARKNSWKNRVEELSGIIDRLLSMKLQKQFV
ncbi:MAG: glycosyltransferase [Cytophagaceae bacterium]